MCVNRLKNTQKVAISEETDFLEFLKNHIFQIVTKYFENCTKREAEAKECVFMDVDH